MSTSVASVVSHFPSAENGFTTTTSGSVSSGATTVGLNSVAGYANGEVAVFVIDPSNASKQTFTGIIDTSGVQVTSVVWTAGSNTTHASGATVVDYATATHISMMTKGLLVQHKQDGTHANTITTNTINENTAANGVTVDGLNLKDSKLNTNDSVVTTNITADAVTDAKLVYGKVRSRQGGSATNWSTVGTTTYDYSGTNTFMQVGSITGNAGADVTVTFPTAFNQVPIVIGSNLVTNSNSIFVVATVSATQFTFRMIDSGGTQRADLAGWMAIGE